MAGTFHPRRQDRKATLLLPAVLTLACVCPAALQAQAPDAGQRFAPLSALEVKIVGLTETIVNRETTFQLELTNTSDLPLEKSTVAVFPRTLPTLDEATVLEGKTFFHVESMKPGEKRTLPYRVVPRRVGALRIQVAMQQDPLADQQTRFATTATALSRVRLDPRVPISEMVPAAPTASVKPQVPQTLAEATELALEQPVSSTMKSGDVKNHIQRNIDRIVDLDQEESDGFVKALRGHRPDLAGLPFALGSACRIEGEFRTEFARLAGFNSSGVQSGGIRAALLQPGSVADLLGRNSQFHRRPVSSNEQRALVAVTMQVLGAENAKVREELANYFGKNDHADATRALARLAIFSNEESVRTAAWTNLKGRPAKDYDDVLRQGLDYPWPDVAKRAGDVIVKLGRRDLAGLLVDALDRADPRAPHQGEVGGKKTTVVRELVRINHHRNCLLCHAPVVHTATDPGCMPAPVLVPNEAWPTAVYYSQSSRDPLLLVRVDTTYLRQDFSVMMPVADHGPWPKMQRFDFLVRTRAVTAGEADAYRDLLQRPDGLSPYQQAALASLRELTGLDIEPNATAWRQALAAR